MAKVFEMLSNQRLVGGRRGGPPPTSVDLWATSGRPLRCAASCVAPGDPTGRNTCDREEEGKIKKINPEWLVRTVEVGEGGKERWNGGGGGGAFVLSFGLNVAVS